MTQMDMYNEAISHKNTSRMYKNKHVTLFEWLNSAIALIRSSLTLSFAVQEKWDSAPHQIHGHYYQLILTTIIGTESESSTHLKHIYGYNYQLSPTTIIGTYNNMSVTLLLWIILFRHLAEIVQQIACNRRTKQNWHLMIYFSYIIVFSRNVSFLFFRLTRYASKKTYVIITFWWAVICVSDDTVKLPIVTQKFGCGQLHK